MATFTTSNFLLPHDITLVSNDGFSFLFWKSVLAKQSDYFRAKFTSGMKDANSDICTFDVTGSLLNDILTIMCKKILHIKKIETLIEMYDFADMYQFKKLLKKIGDIIISKPYSVPLLEFYKREMQTVLLPKHIVSKFLRM